MSGCCNSGGGCGCESGHGGGWLRWLVPVVLIGAVVALAVLRSPAKPQNAPTPPPATTPGPETTSSAAMSAPAASTGAVVTFSDWRSQVVEASKIRPVLVDFNATWCPPCQMLKPVIEQHAKDNAATLSVVAIDTDLHEAVAREQGVTGIPDLRLFVNGSQVAARTGYIDGAGLTAWITANLKR